MITRRSATLRGLIPVALVVICGIAYAYLGSRQAPTFGSEAQTVDPAFKYHIKQKENILAHAQMITTLRAQFMEEGLRRNSAGFHLLRPDEDPFFADPYNSVFEFQATKFHFVPLDPAYTDVTYHAKHTTHVSSDGGNALHVSITELFAGPMVVSTAYKQPDGAGQFSVFVEISESGFGVLEALHGLVVGVSTQSSPVIDWYGRMIDTGKAGTQMTAVVISNSKAYLPFSVTTIVRDHLVGTPIKVAKDLSQAEADALVAFLAP